MPPHFSETVLDRDYCSKCNLKSKNCKCQQIEDETRQAELTAFNENRENEMVEKLIADLDTFWEAYHNGDNTIGFVRAVRAIKVLMFFGLLDEIIYRVCAFPKLFQTETEPITY